MQSAETFGINNHPTIFFPKKYPGILDNAFLKQYLCTCHPEDNTTHNS